MSETESVQVFESPSFLTLGEKRNHRFFISVGESTVDWLEARSQGGMIPLSRVIYMVLEGLVAAEVNASREKSRVVGKTKTKEKK